MARLLYRSLLQQSWQIDTAPYIPNNEEDLFFLSDCPDHTTWEKYGLQVVAMFNVSDDKKFLCNDRLIAEFEAMQAFILNRKESGKSGGLKRAERQAQLKHSLTDSEAQLKQPEPEPEPEPEPKPIKPAAKNAVPDWIPLDSWNGFLDMRKREKHPLTERAIKLTISTLEDLRIKGHEPGKVLDQSTMHGWRGVFELKTNGVNGNGKATISRNEQRTRDALKSFKGIGEEFVRGNDDPLFE